MPRTGDILGYARVSTADQDLSGQKDRLLQHGAIRVFEDVISGKTFNRPGLAALLDQARPNDTLTVIRLDRLGRSLKELLEIVDNLKAREINRKLAPRAVWFGWCLGVSGRPHGRTRRHPPHSGFIGFGHRPSSPMGGGREGSHHRRKLSGWRVLGRRCAAP